MTRTGADAGAAPGASRVVAGALLALTLGLSAAAVVFLVLAWETPAPVTQFGPKGFGIPFALTLGAVGFVLASRRPSNPIGWIFCGIGVVAAVQAIGSEYARWALLTEGGEPPGGIYGAWFEEWLWVPLVGGLGVVAAIFPDGRFLSRRWRAAIAVSVASATVPAVANALIPEFTIYAGLDNPFGLGGDGMQAFAGASVGLMAPLVVIGAAGAVVRFRRSWGEERQQLKWLALSASIVALALVFFGVASVASGADGNPAGLDWAENLMIAAFLGVPVSIGFGVLKYRLYDLDIVISKAVVYGALAVFITLVYAAVVVGVGAVVGTRGDAVLSAVAAAIVALAFQPARRRARRLANRLVYGARATPYEVLSELSTRFAGTYSLEDALPRLARVTGEAVGAERARVWLRSGERLRVAAGWPRAEPAETALVDGEDPRSDDPAERMFPVRHQGELLGAISVRLPASDPLDAPREHLLSGVAAQAGLVIRNVALVEDLRASRQRIVAAQDARARTLERNIHDGAQQQLVALTVKLRLAHQLSERDPAKTAEMLGELQAETQKTLEDLRDLARGIYPPLLADKGLPDALAAQARKSAVSVEVDANGIGRYPQEVESAVYFCVLEALQNVAKYARTDGARVRLAASGEGLRFVVEDDGVGFDPKAARGTGLENMRDRLEALGGSLEIRSAPGAGTTVAGSLLTASARGGEP